MDDRELAPSITDKVRFWEEQQQINSLLIPRVVEITKALATLADNLRSQGEGIQRLDARVVGEIRSLQQVVARLPGQPRRLVNASTVALILSMIALGVAVMNGLR